MAESPGSALQLKNVLLFFVSIVFSVLVAEAAVRYLDGYPMFRVPLGNSQGSPTVSSDILDKAPLAAGVDRQWFYGDPPPLPNRREPPDDWWRLYRSIQANNVGGMDFRPPDVFKAWNSKFVGDDPCKHKFLRHAPGVLYLYDPPDGQPAPPYRYLPNATLPNGLVTNQMGWRGAPIEDPRGDKTIRIVFVGSSTTMGMPHLPTSYPELVGYWLNRWAAAKQLPVRFEVLNTGRESIVSTDTAAVVRNEVVPLRPDLVIYYEGGNQFYPNSVVEEVPKRPAKPLQPPENAASTWLQTASKYSALMARVRAAIALAGSSQDGREWPKPPYTVNWPEGLDEQNPDLNHPELPVSLNVIQHDLDRIRGDLAKVGSDFALSSFLWMVKDGMVLDPVRHKYILEQLNVGYYPFRYELMERLAQFQNRLLAKYAKAHGITFIDAARYVPLDPDLFIDAVHTTFAGMRLQAWIVFNLLVPTVEKHLADHSWPRPRDPSAPAMPTITPRKITFECK